MFDADTADIISKFLNHDPRSRLGAALEKGDLAQIKAHPFFATIDWEKLAARRINDSDCARDTYAR